MGFVRVGETGGGGKKWSKVCVNKNRTVSCGEYGSGERIRMELCAGRENWDLVRAEKSVVVHGNHVSLWV